MDGLYAMIVFLLKREFALGTAQNSTAVATAPTMPKMEEFAKGMAQRRKSAAISAVVTIKPYEEGFAKAWCVSTDTNQCVVKFLLFANAFLSNVCNHFFCPFFCPVPAKSFRPIFASLFL